MSPSYTWVFNTWFLGRPEIVDFWVWAAPAAPETIPEGGERRPPPFGMVFGAAGAAQTPKINDSWPAQSHILKTKVYIFLYYMVFGPKQLKGLATSMAPNPMNL